MLCSGNRVVLGDPEVEHLHEQLVAAADEEQIAGLQVAVHHPAAVRALQQLGHLADQQHRLAVAETASQKPFAELLAVEPLHDDERQTSGHAPVIEDLHDMRTAQLRGDARLALEALRERLVLNQRFGVDELHSDFGFEPEVLCLPHAPHAPLADRTDQPDVGCHRHAFEEMHRQINASQGRASDA